MQRSHGRARAARDAAQRSSGCSAARGRLVPAGRRGAARRHGCARAARDAA
jgi:hypothetical protein